METQRAQKQQQLDRLREGDPSVTSLCCGSGGALDDRGVDELAAALRGGHHLLHLDLRGGGDSSTSCHVTEAGWRVLEEAVASSTLECVELEGTGLSDRRRAAFFRRAVVPNVCARVATAAEGEGGEGQADDVIDWVGRGVDDESLRRLSRALIGNTGVRRLLLGANPELGAEGWAHLAAALPRTALEVGGPCLAAVRPTACHLAATPQQGPSSSWPSEVVHCISSRRAHHDGGGGVWCAGGADGRQHASCAGGRGELPRPVSAFLAWIRSPCLRHCVHGASIGTRTGPGSRRRARGGYCATRARRPGRRRRQRCWPRGWVGRREPQLRSWCEHPPASAARAIPALRTAGRRAARGYWVAVSRGLHPLRSNSRGRTAGLCRAASGRGG
jgi:hypothetical protein